MLFYIFFLPACAISLLWSAVYGTTHLAVSTFVFTVLYSGYGISIGFHRLHSHKSFTTYGFIRKALLYLGCQGAQGSPVTWTLLHIRSHHAHTDTNKDVHTPTKGSMYAFIGWIFEKDNHAFATNEIYKIRRSLDQYSLWCHKNYAALVITNLLVIAILSWWQYQGMLVLASLNASILSVFISGFVNVFGHTPIKPITYCTTETKNNSTNNPWLVFLTWGESLHNNHHAVPRRLSFSTHWYELDVGRWMIWPIQKH